MAQCQSVPTADMPKDGYAQRIERVIDCRDWLIHSAYEPEHAPALEVFLDKESAMDWSHFELDLCLPVRKAGSGAV